MWTEMGLSTIEIEKQEAMTSKSVRSIMGVASKPPHWRSLETHATRNQMKNIDETSVQ